MRHHPRRVGGGRRELQPVWSNYALCRPGTRTAGGDAQGAAPALLAFAADAGENFVAFDARNGEPLWHSRLNGVSNAAETYTLDDRQYVIVAAGDMIYAFTLYE